MIKVRDLSFKYPGDQQNTLDRINLDIDTGDWVVLSGPSGCGKTTLALALAGFLFHLSEGEYKGYVEIEGKKVEELPLAEVSHEIYLVQQNPENQFCTLTVHDEIAFGLENCNVQPSEIEERINLALEIVNAKGFYDANLLELSGGEKQKIAIATAIAMKPKIIILDEPTSNLDPKSSQEIFNALDEIKNSSKITVIIIEHKIQQLLKFKPRVFTMRKGGLQEVKLCVLKNYPRVSRMQKIPKPDGQKGDLVLQLQNFSVKRQDKIVLNVEEMHIHEGEFIALMGPNGSGKTSFLMGLLGLLETSMEAGLMMGSEIRHLKTHDLAQCAGYIFQNPDHQIFCDSVEDEVFLAPENYKLDIPKIKSHMMGMLGLFSLDNKLQDHPFHLSCGQKKRLNLASVLAYSPKLLLLDEIFIGQDVDNIIFTLAALNDYVNNHQGTVILVNHYLKPILNLANRLIFFDEGRVLFDEPIDTSLKKLKAFNKLEYLPDYC